MTEQLINLYIDVMPAPVVELTIALFEALANLVHRLDAWLNGTFNPDCHSANCNCH